MSDQPTSQAPVDLTTCEGEPIHIPGRVQDYGVVLVLDPARLRIELVSTNVEAHFGTPPEEVVGKELSEWAAEDLLAAVQSEGALPRPEAQLPAHLVHCGSLRGAIHGEALLHGSGGRLVLELLPMRGSPDNKSVARTNQWVRTLLLSLEGSATLLGFCRDFASCVRELSGYDRVMVYRFAPDWHGEVVAESKRADLAPFLGLHYPASDIPAQARELIQINPSRLNASIDAADATFHPSDRLPDGGPLDLSLSYLRGTSPIHIEYLQNMGVRASLVIALTTQGRLWGLVACHHYAGPRTLDHAKRFALELLAQSAGSRLLAFESEARRLAQERAERALAEAVERLTRYRSLLDATRGCAPELVDADGFLAVLQGERVRAGAPPEDSFCDQLLRWLEGQELSQEVFASDHLGDEFPPALDHTGTAAGLLAIRIGRSDPSWLLWFRGEQIQTVNWAGEPHKPLRIGPNGLRLHPRGSFALYKEERRGRSKPWTETARRTAERLRSALLDVLSRERTELQQRARDLAAKNTALDAFSSSASHDLRAPLRGMNHLLEFIREDGGELGEAVEGHLAGMRRLTRRMDALVTGLLDYARLGEAELKLGECDLDAIVGRVLDDLEQQRSDVSGEVEVLPALPTIRSWSFGVERVLSNLIGNALKYGGEPPRVEIGQRASAQGRVEIYVQDHGPGIAADAAERIFEPFVRAVRRGSSGGSGLGLAIVRRILERLQGKIWVESVTGGGARFVVELPERLAEAASEPPRA